MLENNNHLVYLYGFSLRKDTQIKYLITILKEQIQTGAKIKIVLMHDGVIGISKMGKTPSALIEFLDLPIEVYAIIPDIKARGIDIQTIHEKIHLIEYDFLVDILAVIPKIVSWL
ncbi:MAG: DsrH/TusB family sulfur metabolism protein [Promethearchaeota archaeon]